MKMVVTKAGIAWALKAIAKRVPNSKGLLGNITNKVIDAED